MGQREWYIMRKGRQIMEDHRAISITLTSILEHSSPHFRSTQWNRPVCLNYPHYFPTLSCQHTPLPLTNWHLATQQSHIWDLSGTHYLMIFILVYSPTVLPHVSEVITLSEAWMDRQRNQCNICISSKT